MKIQLTDEIVPKTALYPKIAHLEVYAQHITVDLSDFVASIINLNSLEHFELIGTWTYNFTSQVCQTIENNSQSLKYFRIESAWWKKKQIHRLLTSLHKCSILETLTLSRMDLNPRQAIPIIAGLLESVPSLQKVDFTVGAMLHIENFVDVALKHTSLREVIIREAWGCSYEPSPESLEAISRLEAHVKNVKIVYKEE
jgi:hypothetical protein